MSLAAQDLNDSISYSDTTKGASDTTRTPRALRNILSLDDFEEPGRRYIPRPLFGYIKSGSEPVSMASSSRTTAGVSSTAPSHRCGPCRALSKPAAT